MGNETERLEHSDAIFGIKCREPDGEVVRYVTESRLDFDRIRFLWEQLKQFDVLFNDFVDGDFRAFVDHFVYEVNGVPKAAGLMWDIDDIGIFFLNNLKPHASAEAHFVFWDKRFRGREELCRMMLGYIFEEFEFQKIVVKVPLYAHRTFLMVERLGFIHEGRLRKEVKWKDQWFDMNVYSILPEDLTVDYDPSTFVKPQKKVCFECGKIYSEPKKSSKSRRVNHGT